MFSSTTIELSTTMPTAKARPARLMTLSVRPNHRISRKVPMTLIGMAIATTNVLDRLRRKSSRTRIASVPPTNRLLPHQADGAVDVVGLVPGL